MAEGILKDLLKKSEHSSKEIEVRSAGISVFQKGQANPKSIKVTKNMDIDISDHTTQALTEELVKKADLILTMTQSHKQQILIVQPQVRDKVFTLLEFIQEEEKTENMDIYDPFGLPEEEYEKTAQQLLSALKIALPKIINKFFA
jgi:protein-tyrosine phosphatase